MDQLQVLAEVLRQWNESGLVTESHFQDTGAVDPSLVSNPSGVDVSYTLCPYVFSLQAASVLPSSMSGAATGGATVYSKLSSDPDDASFEGLASSFACHNGSAVVSVRRQRTDHLYKRALAYTVVFTVNTVLHARALKSQADYSGLEGRASRLSVLGLGLNSLLDSFQSLFHLALAMAVEMFSPLMTLSIMQFVVFSLLEMRLLLLAWKAQNAAVFDQGWEAARRELGKLYAKFYICLMIIVIVVYNAGYYLRWVVLVVYSFWVPQIVQNVRLGTRNAFTPLTVVVHSACRLLAALYWFGCPVSLGRQGDASGFCVLLSVWVGVQAWLLLEQDRRGPAFFVPRWMLPERYDYWRSHAFAADDLCTICMSELVSPDERHELMVCPCNHGYHARCLQQWMEHKMECPTCRRALPPV